MGKRKDIHDRHQVPQRDETFDTASESQEDEAEKKQPSSAKKTSVFANVKGKDEAERQAVRDSFYKEDGVKADGTGGTVPGEE